MLSHAGTSTTHATGWPARAATAAFSTLFFFASPAWAGQVTVLWDPNTEPDLAGYYVDYGLAPGATDVRVNAGLTTAVVLTLQDGRRYYIRVRAYNRSGLVSAPSNEVVADLSGSATDTDGDGMPDAWENQYGVSDPAADDDGDGLTNLQEYQRGTDPTLPNSVILSEGATGFFRERLALVNPGPVDAAGTITFLTPAGQQVPWAYTVPARSRQTVDVNAVPGLAAATAVSAVVDASRGGVAVERTMFWGDPWGARAAGHTGKALPRASTSWFLAEGEAGYFSAWILLANANAQATQVTVDFLLEDGQVVRRTYAVAGRARETIYVNAVPGVAGRPFSTRITSTLPITVERAMYFGRPGLGWEGGHAAAGITTASRTWFVAEGRTGPFFDTYLLLANPQALSTTVTLSYLRPSGSPIVETRTLLPSSRTTILLDAVPGLADTDVSVSISATRPIAVERAMYWPGTGWLEGHASAGLTTLGTRWVLAEGEVGGPERFDTYVLVANPNSTPATVVFTFLRESGPPIVVSRTVGANNRLTVSAGTVGIPSGERFGILVDATVPVAVERSMYWDSAGRFWRGGTNETGFRIR
jgi:hypothetical protein